MRFSSALALAPLALSQGAQAVHIRGGRPNDLLGEAPDKRELLQHVVTWDPDSLFINGERVFIFSGEFHPYRLPVPSLWTDVFEKIKALGLNTASFYVHWALMEGKQGSFTSDGVFDIGGFLEAAKETGMYLNARPGPYINAESSGGGFPGWLQRIKGHLRTNDSDYLASTDNYMANIGRIIKPYQITNGGPVILWQPENEYSGAIGVPFPNPSYMQYVEDQIRNAGIVVPLMNNDAWNGDHNAPGTGEGQVDIYGHDSYPVGFDCANPYQWGATSLPTYFWASHEQQSPTTPYSIPEFQGGSFDPWGGLGYYQCSELVGYEFERVFYKNNFASGIKIMSLYMIYGGTNWGNLGFPGVYTSYDYAAAIKEDRTVAREKYSELKLEAHFVKVSPGYLVANPGNLSSGVYNTNTDISLTPVTGANGSFWVVRHTDYTSTASTNYTLILPTSLGTLNIPQLGGSLTLNGRDSKIHVTDYPVGSATLVYSTAEIFTWQQFQGKSVVVVYGGAGELHELAVKGSLSGSLVEGTGVTFKQLNGSSVAQWQTTTTRRIIKFGNSLEVYILDRNSAYNYWVPELTSESGQSAVIVNGPYLVRSASVQGNTLNIRADFNKTAPVEVIGVPASVSTVTINGSPVKGASSSQGVWSANIAYASPKVQIPALTSLDWYYIDTLPEVQSSYDDSRWPLANHNYTNNTFVQPFLTPVSLYGSDYGFNGGALLYRGHFTATGAETALYISTQGGSGFASSVWLNSQFVGSWTAADYAEAHNSTYTLPKLTAGQKYVFTVVVDNMGLDENWVVGVDNMKYARGILNYELISGNSSTQAGFAWKITGNLGGESYADHVRGPLNEGGLFIERQGYHQPDPPLSKFKSGSSPFEGISGPGLAFYTAKLTLDLPTPQYDIPLSFTFTNDTASASGAAYRAWLYVNGYQFARYVSNVGPQVDFPVPEGILNYAGDNQIGLAIWAVESGGAKIPGLTLTVATPVLTSRDSVQLVDAPAWTLRPSAY